jgi:hypothetical protein
MHIPPEQAGHFAKWWMEREARLKCFNEGLTEWIMKFHQFVYRVIDTPWICHTDI